MDREPHGRKGREAVLSTALVIVLGGLLIFFLNLVSLGIMFQVFAAIFALTLVGFLHYVLWGQSLTQNTVGEREEEQIKARMEQDKEDWE